MLFAWMQYNHLAKKYPRRRFWTIDGERRGICDHGATNTIRVMDYVDFKCHLPWSTISNYLRNRRHRVGDPENVLRKMPKKYLEIHRGELLNAWSRRRKKHDPS